jgi:hypothetical protein
MGNICASVLGTIEVFFLTFMWSSQPTHFFRWTPRATNFLTHSENLFSLFLAFTIADQRESAIATEHQRRKAQR